ncbi:MAG: hypothetical protein RSB49_04100 [Victivallaceae bacterium]
MSTGCSCPHGMLYSFTEYLNSGYEAASKIGLKESLGKKTQGQQLFIFYSLPTKFRKLLPIELHLLVRYENGELLNKTYALTSASGIKIHALEGEDFLHKRGISSYKLILKSGNEEIASRKHHLWTEIIILSDFEQ